MGYLGLFRGYVRLCKGYVNYVGLGRGYVRLYMLT
jgi:hypothetical protein